MNTTAGDEAAAELYPNVAAVGAIYGDNSGNYANFLARVDEPYPADPYFLWDQPLSGSGWVARNPNFGDTGSNTPTNGNSGNGTSTDGSTSDGSTSFAAGTISLTTLSILATWLLV